jgi:hypothetical protein
MIDAGQLANILGARAADYVAMSEEHNEVYSKIVALVLFEIATALIEMHEMEEAA